MDERHWWIAQRIAQAFCIDPSSGFLEKFICEPSTLEQVNNLLCMNGSNKLFFIRNDQLNITNNITVVDNLLKLPDTHVTSDSPNQADNSLILYFIRHDTIQEVSAALIAKEIFCGEIKNVSQILFNVYNDLLLTMFESNKNWGNCTDTNKNQAIKNMEKYVNSINDYSLSSSSSATKNGGGMLKRVDTEALIELKQAGRINADAPIVNYCEELSLEWMHTIECLLSDICDERFIHKKIGPSSEIDRWQRKQRLLSNLTEQLKTKECKSVISALITVKSKVLKRWKFIDTGITDAQNECRDKVKFLESLRRPIDQFYQDATPVSLVVTALPNLCTAMRAVESVSRYYARQGYLGLLFTKVTNQLVNVCTDYLLEMTETIDGEEYFWPKIFKELESASNSNFDDQDIREKDQRISAVKTGKQVDIVESIMANSESFYQRLKTCLLVQTKYKEAFRNLRDNLGGVQALSSFPSISSVQENQSSSRLNKTSSIQGNRRSFVGSSNENKSHGILMSEEDVIFENVDTFCNRINSIIEQIRSLSQFKNLFKVSSSLKRPKKEELMGDSIEDEEPISNSYKNKEKQTLDSLTNEEEPITRENSLFSASKAILDTLVEESETTTTPDKKDSYFLTQRKESKELQTSSDSKEIAAKISSKYETHNKKLDESVANSNRLLLESADKLFSTERKTENETKHLIKRTQTLSSDDVKLMKKYYGKSEGPSISSIIESYLIHMKKIVKGLTSAQIMDYEPKEANSFQIANKSFLLAQSSLEKFLCAYINVTFMKIKKTHDGLAILSKFKVIEKRSNIRLIINDKYAEIFSYYDNDLIDTEGTFEKHCNNPPLLRNAPPIGGAISWIRRLTKNIEDPMQQFKENKFITSLNEFGLTYKRYQKLINSMVLFENNYLTHWKSSIEEAKLGLKSYLLKKDELNLTFSINSDDKLVILFQEVKWLSRLNIDLPSSAKELLAQEKKFKLYKSNLDTLLNDYTKCVNQIPGHMFNLFKGHIKQTLDLCDPGCAILTWNSLNIDSFLKTIEIGVKKLEKLINELKDSKEATIHNLITEIGSMFLFDHEMAFSKRWNPEDFISMMSNSIELQGSTLLDKIKQIEYEIEEIGNMLVILPKDYTQNSTQGRKTKSRLDLNELIATDQRMIVLKNFYSLHLYDACERCILVSLNKLSEACGYKLKMFQNSDDEFINRLFPASNFKEESLTSENEIVRLKSFDELIVASGPRRRTSLTSTIAKATWCDERCLDNAFLNLEFALVYAIPEIVTEPLLDAAYKVVKIISKLIVDTTKRIEWVNPIRNKTFYEAIFSDTKTSYSLNVFESLLDEINPAVKNHINNFKIFDFLWQQDLNTLFNKFMENNPSESSIKIEVEKLAKIERQVYEISDFLNVGPICLNTDSIKTSLKAFAYKWKCKYASVLHEMAKKRLQSSILYRETVQKRLNVNVQTLEQLNDALRLLEELSDMENKIDNIYLPIESIYSDLRRYDLILTREEIEQVTNLRDNWLNLMNSAENVRNNLLQDKRSSLEQELDKQVKTFVVEVIRFRNSFDATGPSVTGIDPYEALKRLSDFKRHYQTFDSRRKTLDSISILFGLHCKPFPELDKTGEELDLLDQLYKVYQVFLDFDTSFRNTLWSEVELVKASSTMNQFWNDFMELPEKLQEGWDAYYDLKKALTKYIEVLPILLLLNAKEIRNRHWLQVMQETKTTFRLESSVFRLNDLIDNGLDLHVEEIKEICKAAKKEQELESQMKIIEEEWNEQVLNFASYKDYGEVIFDKVYTERLLEQLEDAQEILANMLTSKYVVPLQNEVANWFEKLKTIGDVLELWLEVQDQWINIESVFSNQATVKEMPAEAKRFSRVDRSWIRSQKQSFEMKSVIQCCLGSSVQENTKRLLLKDIQKELEICFKSLNGFLDKKRRTFPRYYFLSNSSLLTLLSQNSSGIGSAKPFLSSLFNAVTDIKINEIKDLSSASHTSLDLQKSSSSPTLLKNKEKSSNLNTLSEWEIVQVLSADGEVLNLVKKVPMEKSSAEIWLPKLKESIAESIKKLLNNSLIDMSINNAAIEDLATKYPSQICLIGCIYLWTKEAELSILEAKNERKAISSGSKKFSQHGARLLGLLGKSKWPNSDNSILPIHKLRIEAMVTFCTYLRDVFDSLVNRKIRDVNDFEWQKCFRVYTTDDQQANPRFCVMDETYTYGSEFYGNEQQAVITPVTERCFLTFMQAGRLLKGSVICGKPNSGKTLTAKGFAQYLGKFIYVMSCTSQTDFKAIANTLQGLAQAGSWGLFDEVQNLTSMCVSWFNEYSSGIYQALRKRVYAVHLADGKEIQINSNFGLITTVNLLRRDNLYEIPTNLKTMFRVVSLMEPDFEMIMRIRCVQFGIKGANILATKFKCLYDICHGSLSSLQSKYQLTITSFIAIARLSYERDRKVVNDTRPSSFVSTFVQSASRFGAAKSEIIINSRESSNSTVKRTFKASKEVLSSQSVAVKDLARKSKIALMNYSRNEHASIGQSLVEIIGPRLNPNDCKLFKKIAQDIFGFKDDPMKINQLNISTQNISSLEKLINEIAINNYGLYPNKNWIEKCMQIYSVSNTFKGIILCGPSSTGKTSTLNVLVDALTEFGKESIAAAQSSSMFQQQGTNSMSSSHKIKRINPSALDDESLLFGTLSKNGEFIDGLLTYSLRKTSRNQSTTWLCLDGQILAAWSDNFSSIFDSNLHLQLKNGDHLRNLCKLVFETSDIADATPSLVAKSGIIFYDDELVGWRSIARSWLEIRSNKTEINCLQRCFSKTMDEISNLVLKECKPIVPVREESLFKSCLNLLDSMLTENTNIAGEMHIERLFLFCLIWTFGGVLEQNDQRLFSDLLYRQVTALPDDDLKSSVFEYYVDETGEWDLWTQRVPENVFMENIDLLGNVFVDTIDTIRCRIFLEFSALAHQNVIVFGPRGCGKTKLLQDFVQDFDSNFCLCKRLNFSGATNVSQIQKFIESNIIHRQGFTYGASDNKQFAIFIDDLNAPIADEYGTRKSNEFIRQIMDSKLMYSYTKPYGQKKLEDICFYSTMTHENKNLKTIDSRLLRHSILIYLPSPDEHVLKSIFNGILEASMSHKESTSIDSQLQTAIIGASVKLLSLINQVLKPCPTPGRQHYLFNMKTIITILQSLRKLNESQRQHSITIISLWRHEIFSSIKNQIPRYSDSYWLESTVNDLIKESFPSFVNEETKLIEEFVSFELEPKNIDRPVTGVQSSTVKSHLSQVESIEKVRSYVEQVYNRYKEEFGYHQINLFLSVNATYHLMRIHRVLSFAQCGNLLLIGNVGNHLNSLVKMALYIADIQLLSIDCSKTSLFYDSMRTAIRTAGSENKAVGLIFSSKDLRLSEYLDTISSLLNNGECLHLFSNDEMDGLYHAIGPSIKREYPNMVLDPKKFFNNRVKRNLHICLTLTPNGDIFNSMLKNYTSMISNCQLYWIQDWTEESLLNEAENFMRGRLDTDELRNKVAKCMSEMHMYMLDECRQVPWTGNSEKQIKIKETRIVDAKGIKKEQVSKTFSVNLPNWPYSKNILQELIKNEHTDTQSKSPLHFFVGSNTYLRFMNCFWYYFTTKAKQCENDIIRLRKVLETLGKTREGASAMKAYINDLKVRCKQSEVDSEQTLKSLIEKTTSVEKLKAKLGLGGSLTTLMKMQEDIDMSNQNLASEILTKLLNRETSDEYDEEFTRMKEEGQKSRVSKMLEDHEKAKSYVEECKARLSDKKRQAENWKNKIDKPCIERIRTFQNPPALIGQIMEMITVLVGKRKFRESSDGSHSAKTEFSSKDNNTNFDSKDLKASSKPKMSTNKMERLDRSQWKQYQNIMQDSSKFVELLYAIEWEEGLPLETIQATESYLMQGKDGQIGITGEGSLIESSSKDVNIPAASKANESKGITISAARYASEDASTLVHFAIAILEYSKLCIPLKAAKEKVESLRQEQIDYERRKKEQEQEIIKLQRLEESLALETDSKSSENLTNKDLPRLVGELEELQKKFDESAVKKHRLHKELDSCIQRLESATLIINNITNLEEQWKKWIEEHLSHEQTITNCLISAAYICYCGPFDRDIRVKLSDNFASLCAKYEIPREPQQLFKDFTLQEFLYSSIQLMEMKLLRLPDTNNILENGCFLLEDKSYDTWPLICDSSCRSISWLRTVHKDKSFFIVRQSEMKSVLETCLSEGHYLLLTDCDVQELMKNRRIETVLRNKSRFLTSDKPFKLNLGNHEIECNPRFRLFLQTVSEPKEVPCELAAYTLVVNYKLMRQDIEEELLDRFLILAKPRVDSEKLGLLQEKVDTLKIIDPLEQDITDFLASKVDLLNSMEPTKKLSDLKKLYDEAIDSNIRINNAEEPLIKTRESYREIAQRGAICYDVISCLKEINTNYILSFEHFKLNMFDESLYQFERSSTPQVINKLTLNVFSGVSRILTESDRKLFSILLSMEIEAAAGKLRVGEREFVISPLYGSYFIQTVLNKQISDSKLWANKKPFDWMTEEQFLNLQYLAISQSWFSEPFERMGRDGRETQWRTLCEQDVPENGILPDKLDDILSPIQRCCIIRAVRGDRVLQIALNFVSMVLGKAFITRHSLDFESLFTESSAAKPVVMTYLQESETLRRMLCNFVQSKVGQSHYKIVDVNGLGLASEENNVKKLFTKPMEEGSWIILHNLHNSTSMLNQIESVISECSAQQKLNSNFRCWITLLQNERRPPSSLILNSVRAFVAPAMTFKENIQRVFSYIDTETVKTSNKSEWAILLHNLCFFHGSLNLRSRYTRCGWNSPSTLQFSLEEFLESLKISVQEFSGVCSNIANITNSVNNLSMASTSELVVTNLTNRSESGKSTSEFIANKSASLQAIKFIIADLIYGASACNEYDLQAIEAIGEFWISSIALRKDFEIAKLKYKIPNSFLSSQPKLNSLQQSLENIMPYQLEAPEACHLLPSVETVLGDDVMIMTRLGKLMDCLPSSSINVKISERPLTPINNSSVPSINSHSNNPLVYGTSEFSTASYMASQSKKYNDLNEYCTLILSSKIPKVLSKDQINEKVKKSGGWSTYNNWIVNEMNLLSNLITVIKNQLNIIKNITENKRLGCDWDTEITEIADSLYHQQLPKCWCLLSGSRTVFPYYPLGTFFSELLFRFQHIEKCLSNGRDRMPAYNLSVFYNPQELLALFKHEFVRNKNQNDEIGCIENLVFQSEMTSRDKDHLRDPPKEGIFIYGLYLWGCHWEKSSSELQDQSVKNKDGFMSLPVIHLTCWLESEKPLLNDSSKSQDLYKCPVYANRKERDQSLFEIDMYHTGVPAQKWAMRGVCATLKPY